jgi:hypothetical protein
MKKIIFLLLVVLTTLGLKAQLRVSYTSLQLSNFTLAQFNEVSIYSSLDASTDIRYTLRTDNGSLICELFFKGKKIRTGQNKLTYTEAAIKYGNNIYADLLKQNILNKGDLELCIETHDDNEILKDVEQCFPIDFLTPSPIELSTPENKITLKIDRPEFSWIPPIPTLQNTKYHIVVVAKNENQTCLEAINQNMSLINKKDIITTQINYPSEAQSLEQNKEYCWRVAAYSNNMEYSRSEEWVMKLGGEENVNIGIPIINEISGNEIIFKGKEVEFIFKNDFNYERLNIEIKNTIGEKVMTEIITLSYGYNFIKLDKSKFKVGERYSVDLGNVNGKNLTFYFKKYEN